MQRSLLFFLLTLHFLFSVPGDLFNGPNDPVMVHNVNVITGKLQLGFVDHVVEGVAALSLQRSYANAYNYQTDLLGCQFASGWSFFSHVHLYMSLDEHKYSARIVESSGSLVCYEEEDKNSGRIIMKPSGYNDSEVKSYRLNPMNNRLHFDRVKNKAILYLADGGKRVYNRYRRNISWLTNFKGYYKGLGTQYLLEEEISSSGQRTLYSYSSDLADLTVSAVNPSGTKTFSSITLSQTYTQPHVNIRASTSDGKIFNYEINRKNFGLASVSSNIRPTENITYTNDSNNYVKRLQTLSIPGKDGLKVEYYKKRAKGKDGLEIGYKVKCIWEGGKVVARFDYERFKTTVYDINNLMTKYYYKKDSLLKIERFSKSGKLYSQEKFLWEFGNLAGKDYIGDKGVLLFCNIFKYDEFKNLIEEIVFGKFGESYTKWYKYDKNHLLIEEREESGLTSYFEYLKGTDLITVKRYMDGDKLLLKETFIYDEDLLLVEKRVFDGHRETYERWERDKENGLIIKSDNGLDQIYYTYNNEKKLIKQNNWFKELLIFYDSKGRITLEAFSSGRTNKYSYDEYGNAVGIKEAGSLKKQIEYSKENLPICCTMNGKKSFNTYDRKGRVLTEKNSAGAETSFVYDEFGRVIKKILPEVMDENENPYRPEFKYEYDVRGNVICQTDPSGAIIRSKYNLFNKPTKTVFADGSEVLNSYYKNAELKESTDKDGTKTTYKYDLLNRLIFKKTELLQEIWEYEGRVLKSYTDPGGLVTTYEYDEFLRKITEDCEGRKKEFFYDEMNCICLTKSGELFNTETHDCEGRIIQTSENGSNKISYEYDEEGRKKKAIKHTSDGDCVDQFFWDGEGSLIKHIDPLGGETEFIYDGNKRIEIDPIGNRSIEVFDALKRVVRKEKRSKDGELIFAENFFYDRGGNLKRRYTEKHDLEVEYQYDCMGRVIEELESGVKKTSFKYDIKGRVASKITPNGVSLNYEYDSLDRMRELKSSDNSVWYKYEYTGLDLTKIKDLILKADLEKKYTKFHELSEETGLSGFKTSWYYDIYGRKKQVVLPDETSICYSYKGCYMEKVSRLDKDKKLLYEHHYTKFDLNHHVEEEKLPFHFGLVKTCRDRMQRPTSMISPYHEVGLDFGLSNLVTKKINSITGDKDYSYDSLNQLTAEGETAFDFDSLGNPKEYEINKLNQIVSIGSEKLSYDANGNLIQQGNTLYKYDALNRLTEIIYQNDRKVTFSYDPLSRLVCKNDDVFYLYDGDFEIGTITKEKEILQLKVLGLGVKGDIGAAIMLEFKDKQFIPLHDLQGNIIAILSRLRNIVETYNFNAFGETEKSSYLNPWRYGSKRAEEGLIFYGKRFYDPKLKRWISPDPMGFADSRNLYQFVLNDPLNRLDQFGLNDEWIFNFNNDSSASKSKLPNTFDTSDSDFEDNSYTIELFGSATIGGHKMDLMMVCNKSYAFNFTDEEKSQGYFNMLDHLPDLLKGAENQIALVTFINGMNCSTDRFQTNTNSIGDKLPKGAVLIGLHNPTEGFWRDCFRVVKELFGYPSQSAHNLAAFFTKTNEIMTKHCPTGKVLLIAHSEGCIVTKHCYNLLPEKMKTWMHENVYILALGPLQCIPNSFGLNPINYYAKQDIITGWFAKKPSKDYNVVWVNFVNGPMERRKEPMPGHDFQGYTYSAVLGDEIGKFIEYRGGFYVGTNR